MSLPKFYAEQFREQMLCHPVWSPGEGAAPGDIGVMSDRVFTYQDRYSTYTAVAAEIVEEGIPASAKSKFSVGVSMSLALGANATIDPNAKVGGKLSIKRGGGMVLHVPDQRRRYIRNLREVLAAMPWGSEGFGKGTVLVAEVRLAKAIGLVLSESGNTGVDLTGKAIALQQLDIADASISFAATSEASYTASIGDAAGEAYYPYGLRLYRARTGIFGDGKVVPLEAAAGGGAGPEPFEEVSPYDEEL